MLHLRTGLVKAFRRQCGDKQDRSITWSSNLTTSSWYKKRHFYKNKINQDKANFILQVLAWLSKLFLWEDMRTTHTQFFNDIILQRTWDHTAAARSPQTRHLTVIDLTSAENRIQKTINMVGWLPGFMLCFASDKQKKGEKNKGKILAEKTVLGVIKGANCQSLRHLAADT